METVTACGTAVSCISFPWTMEGKTGVAWSLWLVGSFDEEPVKVKVRDAEVWAKLLEAGQGAQVTLTYSLRANVRRNAAVIERQLEKLVKLEPPTAARRPAAA